MGISKGRKSRREGAAGLVSPPGWVGSEGLVCRDDTTLPLLRGSGPEEEGGEVLLLLLLLLA